MSNPEYSPDELTELLSGLMPDIPGYRVMRLLGRGGMSYVYLGVQESLDRQVAIKVIRPDALKDEVSKLRFEKEARTIAKLQHPCIVGIHEVGRTEQGLMFYVMPFLAKGHVGQRDLSGDEPRIIEVLRALLWALDYAHVRGVVHRDVKSENVLFDNADRPVLADFGIALSKRDRARITGSGFAVGSSPHMAPEQARGLGVDGRADLYSLGVLAYEMLCGQLPYQSDNTLTLALMHAVDPIPSLPADKQRWQPLIDRAMAKLPKDRFADAQEMMAALDQVEASRLRAPAVKLAPTSRSSRLPEFPVAWRKPALAGAAALAVLVSALLWWTTPADSPAIGAAADATTEASRERSPAPPVEAPAAAPPNASPPAKVSVAAVELAPTVPVNSESGVVAPARPLSPGEREITAARQQIALRRLTQPPGDNALESLRAARRAAPQSAELTALGELWLDTLRPYLADALATGKPEQARTLFVTAALLADELQLRSGPAWSQVQGISAAPMLLRLRSALAANDASAVRAVKADVTRWGIAAAALEPLWSQPIVSSRPGDAVRSGQSVLSLARVPGNAGSGLAVMATAVSRDDYARFVAATGRAASSCRIRTALLTLKRRSWDKPGFVQSGDHPVVCVSAADATAYARWLSARDGVTYRLPGAAEWRSVADHPAAAHDCAQGRIICQGRGTHTAGLGPVASPGVHAMHGNVREWQADCRAGCERRLTVGLGWRDSVSKPAARGDGEIDPMHGYDDVGFRLVRDLPGAASGPR